jgi:hypothetical protein
VNLLLDLLGYPKHHQERELEKQRGQEAVVDLEKQLAIAHAAPGPFGGG